MPFYEYSPDKGSCKQCGGVFEVLQGINEKPLSKCPECGKKCHKIMSVFSVGSSSKKAKEGSTAKPETKKETSKGHNHNCAAAGCKARSTELLKKYRK